MSSKCLQRSVQKGLFAVNYKYLYRSYSAVSNLQKQYIAPTYEQIEEYTQNIASVLLSWPAENREYFIATLHKAQANPRRNKNYDSLLTNAKIPETRMKSLDYYKLQHWLPFVHVNDIVQIMDEIQESSILACINTDHGLITYDGDNPKHQQILDIIKTEHYDKMV